MQALKYSSPVRTAHISVHMAIIEYNNVYNSTQHRTSYDNLPSYPLFHL